MSHAQGFFIALPLLPALVPVPVPVLTDSDETDSSYGVVTKPQQP
jgi:hypothetical protein